MRNQPLIRVPHWVKASIACRSCGLQPVSTDNGTLFLLCGAMPISDTTAEKPAVILLNAAVHDHLQSGPFRFFGCLLVHDA
jgi:hypothetical protein